MRSSFWRTKRFCRPAGLALLLAVLLIPFLPGCEESPNRTLLTAPGGRGSLAGRLVFPQSSPPYPIGQILAFQNENRDCQSPYGAIALLGTFNAFDVGMAPEFLMERVASCLWVITVPLEAGQIEFKFVTGTNPNTIAFDTPPDYGKLGANNGSDPLEGIADNPANGPDGNLSVTIPAAGDWTFILNETTQPATYRITLESLFIQTTPEDPTFSIEDLAVGSYDVTIASEGFITRHFQAVEVAHNQVADLDSVRMEVAAGFIRGRVNFQDDPDPRPLATIEVREATSGTILGSGTADDEFTITGIPTGTYDIYFTARCYRDTVRAGIEYVNGTELDVGTTVLAPGSSEFETVQIAGQFTGNFDLNQAPFMTQTSSCVWKDTLFVAGGTYLFKFVTDGAFDSPPDYGGDQTAVLTFPGTFPVAPVTGEGTALNVSFPVGGDWELVLNERTMTFSANYQGDLPEGSIAGTVTFEGIAAPPFPAASVDLLEQGTTTLIASTTTSEETGAFSFPVVPDGAYDLVASSSCFEDGVLLDVTVAGDDLEVGPITLSQGASSFTSIQIAGEMTSWELGQAPFMMPAPGCVWKDTLVVASGNYLFKFVTDGAFDTPPDFGGDQNTVLSLPGTFPVMPVTGEGTALSVSVPVSGDWEFVLDEANATFTADFLGELPPGSISGVVAFDGVPEAPFPAASVELFQSGTTTRVGATTSAAATGAFSFAVVPEGTYNIVAGATCYEDGTLLGVVVAGSPVNAGTIHLAPGGSEFSTIQMAGDFNGFNLGTAPFMIQDPACVWSDTLTLAAGTFNFKFVTDGAFDSPPDYGGNETNIPLPAENVPVRQVTGFGTALRIVVAIPGDYAFTLDERALTFSALLLGEVPQGSLRGAVTFEGISESPFPAAKVDLLTGGTDLVVGSTTTAAEDGTFLFEPILDGTYDLRILASCFETVRSNGFTVQGAEVDAGTTQLPEGVSSFDTIQLAGEVTNWDLLQAPQMTQDPACAWSITVPVAAGTFFLKFVTNGNFDDPPDYGGDEATTLTVPGTFATRLVTGQGTAIRIEVAEAGDYTFVLDERLQQFTVTKEGGSE